MEIIFCTNILGCTFSTCFGVCWCPTPPWTKEAYHLNVGNYCYRPKKTIDIQWICDWRRWWSNFKRSPGNFHPPLYASRESIEVQEQPAPSTSRNISTQRLITKTQSPHISNLNLNSEQRLIEETDEILQGKTNKLNQLSNDH